MELEDGNIHPVSHGIGCEVDQNPVRKERNSIVIAETGQSAEEEKFNSVESRQ